MHIFPLLLLDTMQVDFTVLVTNDVMPVPVKKYSTHVPEGGILQGGLTRLENSKKGFT